MEESDVRTVFCGGLSSRTTDRIVYELFLQAGPIESVHLVGGRIVPHQKRSFKNIGSIEKDGSGKNDDNKDQASERHPDATEEIVSDEEVSDNDEFDQQSTMMMQHNNAYAFITFKYECSVQYAIRLLGGIRLYSRPIRVSLKKQKQQVITTDTTTATTCQSINQFHVNNEFPKPDPNTAAWRSTDRNETATVAYSHRDYQHQTIGHYKRPDQRTHRRYNLSSNPYASMFNNKLQQPIINYDQSTYNPPEYRGYANSHHAQTEQVASYQANNRFVPVNLQSSVRYQYQQQPSQYNSRVDSVYYNKPGYRYC